MERKANGRWLGRFLIIDGKETFSGRGGAAYLRLGYGRELLVPITIYVVRSMLQASCVRFVTFVVVAKRLSAPVPDHMSRSCLKFHHHESIAISTFIHDHLRPHPAIIRTVTLIRVRSWA